MQRPRIIIMGAGCGGFELSTLLSEALVEAADFLSGPRPTGTFLEPSAAPMVDEERFGSSRRAPWLGR